MNRDCIITICEHTNIPTSVICERGRVIPCLEVERKAIMRAWHAGLRMGFRASDYLSPEFHSARFIGQQPREANANVKR